MRTPPSWIPKAFGVAALLAGAVAAAELSPRSTRLAMQLTLALNSAALLWVRQDNVSSEQVAKSPRVPGGGA